MNNYKPITEKEFQEIDKAIKEMKEPEIKEKIIIKKTLRKSKEKKLYQAQTNENQENLL